MKCCKTELELQEKITQSEGKIFFYQCQACGRKGWGKTKTVAEKMFNESKPKMDNVAKQTTTELAKIPNNRNQVTNWAEKNMLALMNQSAQFIDKPATRRMIEKNIRYIANLKGKSWEKVWSTEEGQESISYALSESLYYGATLPEMGSLIPFGTTAEFVPSVECFEFAMKTGKNAPFSELKIIPIHENDTRKIYQKDENFIVELEYGIPRGEIIAVAVQGKRTDTGKFVGELYDVERLLEKARQHSQSYRQYILDKEDFIRLRSEGKLKFDESGREYVEKQIKYFKGGQEKSFIKQIYEHDIINPYDGPDRPEMLRKAAGKSFFRPFMRVRNASAMADEWQEENVNVDTTREQAADHVLRKAAGQFDNIVDAEIVIDKTTAQKKDQQQKKEVEKINNISEDHEINGL